MSVIQHKESEEKAKGLFLGFDSSFKPTEHQEEEVEKLWSKLISQMKFDWTWSILSHQ